MIWVEITYDEIVANLPTDISDRYDVWIAAYPEKEGRLEQIMENTIREFRDALKSHPRNVVDTRDNYLPQSSVRHLESIIIFQIAMEMGISVDTSGNSAKTQADIFLRGISFGRYNTTTADDADLPRPRYSVPSASAGRVLPAYLLLIMLLPTVAFGGWIKPGSVIYDTDIITTILPTNYVAAASTLIAQLYGIDGKFAQLQAGTNFYSKAQSDALYAPSNRLALAETSITNKISKTGDTMSGALSVATITNVSSIHGNGTDAVVIRAPNYGTSDGAFVYISAESTVGNGDALGGDLIMTAGDSDSTGGGIYITSGKGPSDDADGSVNINARNQRINLAAEIINAIGTLLITDPNTNAYISLTVTGGLQVGQNSFHATPSGDILQDATNSATLGFLTVRNLTATGTISGSAANLTDFPATLLSLSVFQASQAMTNTLLRVPGGALTNVLVLIDGAGTITTQKIISITAQ